MPTSGPIVRSGPSPEYTKNWGAIFSGGKSTTPKAAKKAGKKGGKKGAKKSGKKSAKKAKK